MKQRKDYASELTKEYLIKLGVTDITPDGLHVYKNGVEAKQHFNPNAKRKYFKVEFYDPEIRQATPKEERNNSTGQFMLDVHVMNYAWQHNIKPVGLIVDHIDNDPQNNDINNLQLLTQKENLEKQRGKSTAQLKCNLKKPLSFYEDKLKMYTEKYEAAKKAHDADEAKLQRGNMKVQRDKIRYYLAHKEEAEELQRLKEAENFSKELHSIAYKSRAQQIKILNAVIDSQRAAYKQAKEQLGADHEFTKARKAL